MPIQTNKIKANLNPKSFKDYLKKKRFFLKRVREEKQKLNFILKKIKNNKFQIIKKFIALKRLI